MHSKWRSKQKVQTLRSLWQLAQFSWGSSVCWAWSWSFVFDVLLALHFFFFLSFFFGMEKCSKLSAWQLLKSVFCCFRVEYVLESMKENVQFLYMFNIFLQEKVKWSGTFRFQWSRVCDGRQELWWSGETSWLRYSGDWWKIRLYALTKIIGRHLETGI